MCAGVDSWDDVWSTLAYFRECPSSKSSRLYPHSALILLLCILALFFFFSNLLFGFIVAPLIFLMSAVSLTSLLRLTDYVATTAKSTSIRGWEREYLKPLCKNLAPIFERILGGNKIAVTPTNILLMAIVIVLFAILVTLGEKNDKEKKSNKEKKN